MAIPEAQRHTANDRRHPGRFRIPDSFHWLRQGNMIGPLILTEIAKVYREEEWILTPQERQDLTFMADFTANLAQNNPGYQPHADWFQTAERLEEKNAAYPDIASAMYQFCIQNDIIVEGDNHLHPFEVRMELMDLDDPRVVAITMNDYWKVKHALAPPTGREVKTRLTKRLQGRKFRPLPQEQFSARNSLLLTPSSEALAAIARYENAQNRHVVMELGPGKGEVALDQLNRGNIVVAVDFQSASYVEDGIYSSYRATGSQGIQPKFQQLSSSPQVNQQIIKAARRGDLDANILICQQDVRHQLPFQDGTFDGSVHTYLLHHLRKGQEQETLLSEQARVTRTIPTTRDEKAALTVDASCALEPFTSTFIPVAALLRAHNTFIDGAISHSRGHTPRSILKIGRRSDSRINWYSGKFGPNIRKVIMPQQVYLAAFHPDRIDLEGIAAAL